MERGEWAIQGMDTEIAILIATVAAHYDPWNQQIEKYLLEQVQYARNNRSHCNAQQAGRMCQSHQTINMTHLVSPHDKSLTQQEIY